MNIGASAIRTLVPLLVGYLVSFLVSLGVTVTDDNKALLTNAIGLVVAWLYYVAARFMEQKFPWATILLGSNVQPVAYQSTADVPTVATPAAAAAVAADAIAKDETPTAVIVDDTPGKHEAP